MNPRHIHSGMRGAPTLNGLANSGVSVLDAVLVTGFAPTNAIGITVLDGIATVSLPSMESFDAHATVRVAGADTAALNGDFPVLTTTSSSITYATAAANGTATGTITVRYAPLPGWEKVFSDTGRGAYRSTALESTGCLLAVDDTGTFAMRVVGYESMSDMLSGTGPFPTPSQLAGGGYWPKSSAASSAAVVWDVVGDDLGFHWAPAPFSSASVTYAGRTPWWFGDILSRKSGDDFGCLLVAGGSNADANGTHSCAMGSAAINAYIARSHTQVGGSTRCGRFSPQMPDPSYIEPWRSGSAPRGGTYPNMGQELLTTPLHIFEGSNGATAVLRGTVPGILHTPLLINQGTFSPRDVLIAEGDLAGRRLLALPGYAASGAVSGLPGCVFFDTTGPWR